MGALFPFLSGVSEFFCKTESKFLNSRGLADGFVMECPKSLGFKHFVMRCAKKIGFKHL